MNEEKIQLKQKDIKTYRDSILEEQNGICYLCKKEPLRPTLDHHHTKKVKGTGCIRGVLCSNCNVILAKVENNAPRYGIRHDDLPEILRNMADYLEKEQYPLLHPSEKPKEPKLKKSSYNKLKKIYNSKKKFPEYPKSGKLIKILEKMYTEYELEPEFYKK